MISKQILLDGSCHIDIPTWASNNWKITAKIHIYEDGVLLSGEDTFVLGSVTTGTKPLVVNKIGVDFTQNLALDKKYFTARQRDNTVLPACVCRLSDLKLEDLDNKNNVRFYSMNGNVLDSLGHRDGTLVGNQDPFVNDPDYDPPHEHA